MDGVGLLLFALFLGLLGLLLADLWRAQCGWRLRAVRERVMAWWRG